MRRSRTALSLLAFIALSAVPGHAQPASSADLGTLARQWLRNECGSGDAPEARLAEVGAALVPWFARALQNGPPAEDLSELEVSAGKRFARREAVLQREDSLGLSAAQRDAARKVTRADYVARERSNFDLRYRSQAILGLAIVGGPEAKATLRRLAGDKKSPLSELAAQGLARMAKPRR